MQTRIEASHVSRTYGGCLEGLPGPEFVIAAAKRRAREQFGVRPVLVLDKESLKNQGVLPEYTVITWLSSFTPNHLKNSDGSELVVIYFLDKLNQDLMPNISDDDWKKYAKDWEW